MRPRISVIVPTYDRPHLLADALAGLVAQDIDKDEFEAVVVNDGGVVDSTPQVRAAREQGLAVQYIVLPERSRVSAARNAGIEAARGEYVAFLDDDDFFLPSHLRITAAALDEDREIEAVYTSTLLGRRRLPVEGPYDADFVWDFPYAAGLLDVCDFIPPGAGLFRAFRDTPARYDAELRGVTDWDMLLRLARDLGYRFRHVDVPTSVFHRIAEQDSMTSATGRDPVAQAAYTRLMIKMWKRWPARDEKTERFRRNLVSGYWAAVAAHDTGIPPLSFYEECTRLVVRAWHGEDPEDELVERIACAAVAAEPAPVA
jgi:glycosyltransferase involved in cell wall biosynthesis